MLLFVIIAIYLLSVESFRESSNRLKIKNIVTKSTPFDILSILIGYEQNPDYLLELIRLGPPLVLFSCCIYLY